MRRASSLFIAIAGLAILPGVCLAAGSYSVTGIAPPSGDNFSAAFDLNNSGQVVGAIADFDLTSTTGLTSDVANGFLFSGSTFVVLPNFGALPNGKSNAYPSAINNSGEIVGAASSPAGDVGFTYSSGTLTNLSTLLNIPPVTNGGLFGAAGVFTLGPSGEIGGEINNGGGLDSGYLYNGTLTKLPTLPGPYTNSFPLGINASGVAVGVSLFNNSTGAGGHAFLYDGTMQDIGTPTGTTYDIADGINASGNAIVWAGSPVKTTSGTKSTLITSQELTLLASGPGGLIIGEPSVGFTVGHAYFYNTDLAQFTDLGTLGGAASVPLGINDDNDVVGTSLTAGGDYHAFLDNGVSMVDLNSLLPDNSGWTLITADAINDKGDIAGFGTLNGNYQAFLLTPGGTISGTGGTGGNTGGTGGSTGGNTGGNAIPLPPAACSGILLLTALAAIARFRTSERFSSKTN
jgi:probable HAF family extracellular repeat protein